MNPVEVVKIRLQIQGELANASKPKKYKGMFHGLAQIARDESIAGLYKGYAFVLQSLFSITRFLPALLREAVYASIRFGCYEPMKVILGEDASKGMHYSIGHNI